MANFITEHKRFRLHSISHGAQLTSSCGVTGFRFIFLALVITIMVAIDVQSLRGSLSTKSVAPRKIL